MLKRSLFSWLQETHAKPTEEIYIRTEQAGNPGPCRGTLAVDSLAKTIKRRSIVNGVSLSLNCGEVVGLLGPNGAGKTTVFYMIVGLTPADSGCVTLDGQNITQLRLHQRAHRGIGYLPQEASIFRGLTVEENILTVLEIAEPDRQARIGQLELLLEEFKITGVRKAPAIALSGGERRRVEVARAVASRPKFMLLDEPFAGIDPIAVKDIRELVEKLTKRGIGVLITDHNVRETLKLVDRAYIIYDGQIMAKGTPDEIVANQAVQRVYLGEKFRLG